MTRTRAVLIWIGVLAAVAGPLVVTATSPLLAWRQPVYIAASFAGVLAMGLLFVQPLLAGGVLPGLPQRPGRRAHRVVGVGLLAAVVLHVVGLWITSPPDVMDALLFRSPTPFSAWGVVAMWAVFGAALLAALRPRLRPRLWRLGHSGLVAVVVVTTVVHALRIDGTLGLASKLTLGALSLAATAKVLADLRVWRLLQRRA